MLLDSDKVRLRHIVDAAREAIEFAHDVDFEAARQDRQLQHSLVRCIEIIGEAASRVSLETRAGHPEIPWQDMIGMRNRIVHAYFDIDVGVVWQTVKDELPALLPALEAIVNE
ncbi:MAG: DUF86 domain-containing protein [Candidatus Hydrogenedentes bacterium]|nr:DUF86 domain-containing protein [Candidatus Hydrogenedentota bacterium]